MFAVITHDAYSLDSQPAVLYIFKNKTEAISYFTEVVGIPCKYTDKLDEVLYGEICSPDYGFIECSYKRDDIARFYEECTEIAYT